MDDTQVPQSNAPNQSDSAQPNPQQPQPPAQETPQAPNYPWQAPPADTANAQQPTPTQQDNPAPQQTAPQQPAEPAQPQQPTQQYTAQQPQPPQQVPPQQQPPPTQTPSSPTLTPPEDKKDKEDSGNNLIFVLFAAIVFLALIGVGVYIYLQKDKAPTEPNSQDPNIEFPTVDQPIKAENVSAANNAFNFVLLDKLTTETPDENIFISPLSMEIALLMTYNGAAEQTAEEMAATLGVSDLEKETVLEESESIMELLNRSDDDVTIAVANSLWGRKEVTFLDKFINSSRTYFDAEVRSVEFTDPETIPLINSWVEDHTNDTIKDILTAEDVDATTTLVLVNAIYFNGTWEYEFDKELTEEATFTKEDNTETTAQMMFQESEDFKYFEGETLQLVELPYTDDNTVMRVLLPKEGNSITSIIGVLNSNSWFEMVSLLEKKEGAVYMPKFKFGYGRINMIPYLQAMGMEQAFIPGTADFTAMSAEADDWYIDFVYHKSFIDVDEEGTEAAAATAVGTKDFAIETEPDTFTFRADHPFFFTIEDKETNTILFSGVVRDPVYEN